MKLRQVRAGKFDARYVYKGQRKNVKYDIIQMSNDDYYVIALNIKKNLVFNSLWLFKPFIDVESAHAWCMTDPDIEVLRKIIR